MNRIWILVVTVFLLLGLTGCAEQEQSLQIIAMDTAMTFTAYGKGAEEAIQDASVEVRRLDKLLSRTDENSVVSQLNTSNGTEVEAGEEVCALLDASAGYTASTNGAFDITIAPVVSAWGFTTASHQVPDSAELEALLECVGMERLTLTENTVVMEPDTQIDLGAIAKGYASDRIADIFRENKLERGWAALGGNVLTWGTRPDKTPWVIGIQDPARPNDPNAYVGTVRLEDAFAVTSGSYQRFFEENGKTYHHIIDPATGCPADSGLMSVTIVADAAEGNGTMCDALSTALFLLPMDAGQKLLDECGAEAMWVDAEGNMYYSTGFEKLIRT